VAQLKTTAATFGPVAVAPVVVPKPAAPTTPRLIGGRTQSPSAGVLGGRSGRQAGRAGGAALGGTGLAPASGLLAAPAAAATGKSTPAAAPAKHAQPAPSQLVTTVTRFINVIPSFVRIVIGALVALALALGVSSRLASARARRLARQRRQLLEDVGLLQAALLPPVPPRLGPVATSSAYRPASGPGAGGDFYDVFALGDGQVAVIVGDVSGHGRTSLPQTTLVRYTLRAYLEAGMSPRSALQMAAPVLERQLGDSFATVVLATYHPRDRRLVYSCAGHPPPLILGSESVAPVTACSSPPIGAGQPTGMRQTVVSLPGSTVVCFHTDGLLDARVGGQLFGAARIERTLTALGPDATATALLDSVAEEADQRPDDMAACLLGVKGDRTPPSLRVEEVEIDRLEIERDRVERLLLARGVEQNEVDRVMSSARRAVTRDGAVVLELYLGEGRPEAVLRPQNITAFEPTIRASSRALEMSG
jgi:serine phosphatase RsbU (regulator of sigma subunit)